MKTLDELFTEAAGSAWQDMNAHVWTLRSIASECKHITEFGVREGVSTAALLAGKPKTLISYDIDPFPREAEYVEIAKANGISFTFKRQDDCKELIASTDFLFIDTEHTYEQLDKELKMHKSRVRKWIGMHDTHMELWSPAHPRTSYSMWKAINDLVDSGEWFITLDEVYSSGLTILERVSR